MKYFLKKLWIICIFSCVSGKNENFDSQIFKLSSLIINEYFKMFKCFTIITDSEDKGMYKNLPVVNIKVKVGYDENLNFLLIQSFDQGCGGFIIQTEPKTRVHIIDKLINAKKKAEKFRYNKERYLFLAKGSNDSDLSVLQHPKMFFLPNSLLVISTGKYFYLYSHTVFDPRLKSCCKLINTYTPDNGFKWNINLYPDRIKNVQGKQIVLGMMHYLPYTLILDGMDGVKFDGLEVRLIDQFAKTINATWSALDHPKYLWGTKFPNGSGNGVFGSVESHRADMGVGGFYQWFCDDLDCSYPYMQADVTCLVPKPHMLSGWLIIFLPFSVSTWIGFIAAFFVSLIFVFGIVVAETYLQGKKLSKEITSTTFKSFYTIYRLQIQQVPKSAHKNTPLATFIKISTFYYFMVCVFWQGGIASILTVPRYEDPINSALDLVQKWPKVEWGAIHKAWANSIENSPDPVLHEIVTKFVVLDRDTLIRRSRTRDFAFFIEKLQNGHFGFSDYINNKSVSYLRLMEKSLYSAFGVAILPRSSPYTEKLDNVIHWLYATGIIQKFEVQVSLERIDNHLQKLIRYSNEKDPVQIILKLRHVEGAIYIYFAGIFLSSLSFLVEKNFFKYQLSINSIQISN